MNIKECASLLAAQDNYLILTHKNPDGDTVMSAAALCRALRRKNKKAYLYGNNEINQKMKPFAKKQFAPASFQPTFIIAVDIATESLFPDGFSGAVDLCTDHHPTNSHYAKQELIDSSCSACGEIIQKLIREYAGKLTKSEATLLYIALTTDTGAFQYANVNANTFRAAAELLQYGADAHQVMLRFFRKTGAARLRLEGEIYSNLHYYYNGRLVIAPVTQRMITVSGAGNDDFDDLAGLSGRAEGALMNITIRELPNGDSKVSVRSAPEYSSIAVCEAFGGGGHFMAAGCTIERKPEQAEKLLLQVIDALQIFREEE